MNDFQLNETYYIGDSSSLWAYRGVENNEHIFQCVEFDSEDEYKEFSIETDLNNWIKKS